MKILSINKYFYNKGGSEASFLSTAELLKKKGHASIVFSMQHPMNLDTKYEKHFVSNVDYEKGGLRNEVCSSMKLLYSNEARRKLEELIEEEKPDVAHLHNIHH